jgi:hypothetical protein
MATGGIIVSGPGHLDLRKRAHGPSFLISRRIENHANQEVDFRRAYAEGPAQDLVSIISNFFQSATRDKKMSSGTQSPLLSFPLSSLSMDG